MILLLKRSKSTEHSTSGVLTVNSAFECYTLEDVVRAEKIPGETAIPAGKYRIVITYSNRFKRDLPLLVDVPGFEGVRIHPGNTDQDTEGCILVGTSQGPDRVNQSQLAFTHLWGQLLQAWIERAPLTITIEDAP